MSDLDAEATLESRVLGEPSGFGRVNAWRTYADYAVVRVNTRPPEFAKAVADFSRHRLSEVPYRLRAGLVGEKFMNAEAEEFGLHCGYLVWYAWKTFGVDLDGTGGRLVTPRDLLLSDQVEVVQVYGMTPSQFSQEGWLSHDS